VDDSSNLKLLKKESSDLGRGCLLCFLECIQFRYIREMGFFVKLMGIYQHKVGYHKDTIRTLSVKEMYMQLA